MKPEHRILFTDAMREREKILAQARFAAALLVLAGAFAALVMISIPVLFLP